LSESNCFTANSLSITLNLHCHLVWSSYGTPLQMSLYSRHLLVLIYAHNLRYIKHVFMRLDLKRGLRNVIPDYEREFNWKMRTDKHFVCSLMTSRWLGYFMPCASTEQHSIMVIIIIIMIATVSASFSDFMCQQVRQRTA